MSHDEQTPGGVQLEIAVPVIQFPRLSDSTLTEASPDGGMDMIEQARLQRLDLAAQHNGDQGEQAEEIATYTTQHGPFRQIRFRQIPTLGQRLRIQIWRRWPRTHSAEVVNDELNLSVSFVSRAASLREELWPGVNQVVIQLDAEGMPTNYSIDGTPG